VEAEGREASERRVPETLEEAYELRDASVTPEGWDHYQKHIYRLRGEEYRSRGIRTDFSVQRRERSWAEALRAEDAGVHRTWWKRVFGRRK
jgi:hypothetical protein